MTLKDSGGNVVGTTTTDADGYYWFQNLTEKAKYTLEFEKPSGYSWTTQNSGADKSDSDVDPTTSTISFTAPTWVEGVSKNLGGHDKADDPTLDAGLIKPIAQVSVGDYVWKDTDHDGIQDSGEPGIKGDTSGKAVKPATLDTGIEISVPLFCDIGTKVKVDTRDGTFIERVK